MARVVQFANQESIPWMVLGNASNIIVRDGGIRGFVILCDKLNNVSVDGYTIEAEAGANLIETTRIALRHSLTGFEFACGIPGSIGGAIFMNAGAYGERLPISCSLSNFDQGRRLRPYLPRNWLFLQIIQLFKILELLFCQLNLPLSPGNHQVIKQEMDRLTHLRELKQPLEYPSCGSVFKRPVGHFAGQLISEAGLKGYRIGGVEVSEKHAGS